MSPEGRDVALDSAEGSFGAERRVLTHHQHKHAEEEQRRGGETEKPGGRCYIRYRHRCSTAAEANPQDKRQ